MKRNQSTALLRHFSSGLRLSLAFGVAGVFVSVGSAASTSKDTYYVNDHLATTVATSDAAGEIAQIESDAFGTQAGPVAKDSRFTGKPYDADMGAYVFPFRNYRSDEARWMSADPSGFPDGSNAFAYAPTPVSGLDALGLQTTKITFSPSIGAGDITAAITRALANLTVSGIVSSGLQTDILGKANSLVTAAANNIVIPTTPLDVTFGGNYSSSSGWSNASATPGPFNVKSSIAASGGVTFLGEGGSVSLTIAYSVTWQALNTAFNGSTSGSSVGIGSDLLGTINIDLTGTAKGGLLAKGEVTVSGSGTSQMSSINKTGTLRE